MEADDDDEEVDKDKGDCEEGRIDGDDVVRVDDMRKAIVCEGGNDFVDGGDEEEPALDEVCLAEKLDGAVGLAPVEDSALESEFLEELADDELYRDSVYGDKVYGYSAYGDEVYGDGVYGEGVYGERVYGDGVYGEGVYGDSVYGDWLYGDGVYGDGVYGVGVYGDGLYDKSFKIGELRCTIGVDAAEENGQVRVTPLRIAAMVSVSVLVSVDDDSDAVGELVMLVHALSIEDIEDTSVEVPVEQLADRIQWSDQLK